MASFESGSGERDVNAELNIVPFIDLMSVCIIFLLLTAVWTQVSMIQIGSSVYGKRSDPADEPPPQPEIMFKLEVRSVGYRLSLGRNVFDIPKDGDEFNKKLLMVELKKIKAQYPDKQDAMIAVADELTYEDLIGGGMDSLLLSGFPEVAIQTGVLQ